MLTDFRIYLLTWNVVGRPPMENLNTSLGLEEPVDPATLPDIYFIGLQEVNSKPQNLLVDILFNDPWVQGFKDILSAWDYVKFRHVRLQGIMLLGFCKREHLSHLLGVQTEYTRTGLGGMWGNKGGTSIRLNVYGCSICVVNTHLAAGDEFIQQRILDYNTIIDKQRFVDPETDQILTHDYVFWIGDLNFRINDWSGEEIMAYIRSGKLKSLLSKDQLNEAMKMGDAFVEFTETPPLFPPTYKFILDSDEYVFHKRKPAWTDRILFRHTENAYNNVTLTLNQNHYFSHSSYTQSDHKPVSSSFTIKVFADVPVQRKVYFMMNKVWTANMDSSVLYCFKDGVLPNSWDWIGLYKANFNATDDYINYVWASNRQAETMDIQEQISLMEAIPEDAIGPWYKVVFADQNVLVPGLYRFLYVSSQFEDVLGISDPFEIVSS